MRGGRSEPKRLLLVVDDEQGMRDTLADILEESGFLIDQAANGLEAVEKVKTQEYGLVLMDIRMPVMDGVSALGQMKQLRPELPVIMMTAYTQAAEVAEARRQGAETVVYKPLDIPGLLDLIRLSMGSTFRRE
ncbi:MAG TPA: response regulator [Anaerolineae bacterium]|nr:response regulator [Anaerolineae bacterium]